METEYKLVKLKEINFEDPDFKNRYTGYGVVVPVVVFHELLNSSAMNLANVMLKAQGKEKDVDTWGLYNPQGELMRSGQLDHVTSFAKEGVYSTEMWNALFRASTTERIVIFKKNGWSVKKGSFIPNKST